jgi:hypothetical protein
MSWFAQLASDRHAGTVAAAFGVFFVFLAAEGVLLMRRWQRSRGP